MTPEQIKDLARKLCYQIEECGASEALTKASVMASDLSAALASAPSSNGTLYSLLHAAVFRWKLGVDRWRRSHDSIPAAFVELASTMDAIEQHLQAFPSEAAPVQPDALREALDGDGCLAMDATNLDAIAYRLEQGKDNGDLYRGVLAQFLRTVSARLSAARQALSQPSPSCRWVSVKEKLPERRKNYCVIIQVDGEYEDVSARFMSVAVLDDSGWCHDHRHATVTHWLDGVPAIPTEAK